MKWRTPIVGDWRSVTRFLWLPVTIGGDTRWLERATYREQLCTSRYGDWWRKDRWEK